jgi:hypothetical protein
LFKIRIQNSLEFENDFVNSECFSKAKSGLGPNPHFFSKPAQLSFSFSSSAQQPTVNFSFLPSPRGCFGLEPAQLV